ncbi:hypothetical protein ACROYT_G000667 [Oculina patagonica]
MASICVKNYVKSVRHFPDGKESTADKLQRQLRELERRVDKYFDDLDNVEIICEQAKADIERFQLKAKVEKEILKKDAEIQMKLFSAVREMNDKREVEGENLLAQRRDLEMNFFNYIVTNEWTEC